MYGKFFRSAYEGSMHGAGFHVFAVWGYAIANADRKGFVDLNPKAIGPKLGGSVQDVEAALEYLQRPDPDSRSIEEEGRRIVREGTFLFRVVNIRKYREIRDEDEKRESDRKRMHEKRLVAKSRQESPDVAKSRRMSSPVAECSVTSPKVPHVEVIGNRVPSGTSSSVGSLADKGNVSPISSERDCDFEDFWKPYPDKTGKKDALRSWKKLSAADREAALAAVVLFAEAWRGAPDDRAQFIPNPTTWLNQGRWADDPAVWWKKAGHPNGNGNGKPAGPSPDLVERRHEWQAKHDAMWDAYELASLGKDPAAAALKKAWEDDLATYPK